MIIIDKEPMFHLMVSFAYVFHVEVSLFKLKVQFKTIPPYLQSFVSVIFSLCLNTMAMDGTPVVVLKAMKQNLFSKIQKSF